MFKQDKAPSLGSGQLLPSKRQGVRKAVDNEMGQNMKTRYNESFDIIMTEDRKKVRQKVSQMKQQQPNGEIDVKLNPQDVLRINPTQLDLIGPGNSNSNQ